MVNAMPKYVGSRTLSGDLGSNATLLEVYLNPLVWGKGNVHVLGDRGTVSLELDDVKRFDSGVVLLAYRPGVV